MAADLGLHYSHSVASNLGLHCLSDPQTRTPILYALSRNAQHAQKTMISESRLYLPIAKLQFF